MEPGPHRLARIYFAVVIGAGVLAIPGGWILFPVPGDRAPELLYLALVTQVAALMPIRWQRGSHYVFTASLVAAGLAAPGAGVALLAWFAIFDGRRPGRDMPPVQFVFNRANLALAYAIPSVAVLALPQQYVWSLPAKAICYGLGVMIINYTLTGVAVGLLHHTNILRVLSDNVPRAGLQSVPVLGFAGGIIYFLLEFPVGYLFVPGLLAFLIAVRSNMAYAKQQIDARLQTLELLAQALDARDHFTVFHSQRVAELAVRLGESMGLGDRQLDELRTAGQLHDLGKIGVRDEILLKPGRLTPEEWAIMKSHAAIGSEMIASHSEFARIAPMVRSHHERWNGTGYPDGLVGEDVPMGARILAVADSFDTITEARLYRPSKMSPIEAVEDISKWAAQWYDPKVVDALRRIYGLEPLIVTEAPAQRSGMVHLVRANPKAAALLAGGAISAIGDPLTTVGSLIALYAVTHSPYAVAGAYIVKAVATVLIVRTIGAAADRFARRRLIVGLEMVRAALLGITPFLVMAWLPSIFAVLFVTAAIGAIVQPARQAALAEVVAPPDLGTANALTTMLALSGALVGYPLAGGILWLTAQSLPVLFWIDALTFVLAGLLLLGAGDIGGAHRGIRLSGAAAAVIARRDIRGHLAVAAIGALFTSMSLPALIVLAYQQRLPGPQAYTALEAALACGVIAGSILVARLRRIGAMSTAISGLLVTGCCSIGVGLAPSFPALWAFLLVASVGNPIYVVGNQTALLERSRPAQRASVMTVRFGVVQTAAIVGASLGSVLNGWVGPRFTYMSLGVGLLALSLICLMPADRLWKVASGADRETASSAVG